MELFRVVLTFDSADETLWCDHSNETSSAVLLHGTIYIEDITRQCNTIQYNTLLTLPWWGFSVTI